jgi:hypothetical protein
MVATNLGFLSFTLNRKDSAINEYELNMITTRMSLGKIAKELNDKGKR